MRRALIGLLAAVAFPASATAAPVIVLGNGGHAVVRNDPYVTGPAITPAPAARVPRAAMARASATRKAREKTVSSELLRLYRAKQIAVGQYRTYNGAWNRALAAERRLKGVRQDELAGVTTTMHGIAAGGQLTASRLPALFATLARNQQWWSQGPLLSYGQRVEFADSGLVWEFYPGQGIQLQVLGSFGKADGLYTAGPSQYPAMKALLAQLIPLAANRAGGLTWEYYFNFDGGQPPWTSAMSQGTAIEALTRAYQAFGDPGFLALAHRALPVFTKQPTNGVRVATKFGARYLQYSFAPTLSIINAFLQSLIGLYDYAHVSGDPAAVSLFNAGDAEAAQELPSFDTGAWSLYQPGVEDTLDYHTLVTGFLQDLCQKTDTPIYCQTAEHFTADLKTPPVLQLLSTRLAAHRATGINFGLSKISHVGIVVMRGSQPVFLTSADFSHGVHHFTVPALSRHGTYTVRLSATDEAGNFARIQGDLTVTG